MAEDWAAVAAEVAEALGEFQQITLTQPGAPGGYDEANDVATEPTAPVEHVGSGIEEFYSAQSVDGDKIQQGDIRFMLSPLKADGSPMPLPIAEAWTATKSDGEWLIKKVDRVAPAGVVAYFVLQLRRMG